MILIKCYETPYQQHLEDSQRALEHLREKTFIDKYYEDIHASPNLFKGFCQLIGCYFKIKGKTKVDKELLEEYHHQWLKDQSKKLV